MAPSVVSRSLSFHLLSLPVAAHRTVVHICQSSYDWQVPRDPIGGVVKGSRKGSAVDGVAG
eukprot:768451-Hanusia_phi.AAC.3